ncbi:c-type cytochrome [Herbaspirillum sp. HC18]|nr:c-type cytochrome [Herbaspirillum sp. HC18]
MKSPRILSRHLALFCAAAVSMPAFAAMSADQVEPFLKKEGCFKCHAIDKTKKGPSYKKIADKYKGKPEGEEKVIKNITTGPKVKLEDGTEEEHKVISTKDQGDLKAVAAWILSR